MTENAHRYCLHGIELCLFGNAPAVLSALHARLRPFSTTGDGEADLTFEFHVVPDPEAHCVTSPTGRLRPVYDLPQGAATCTGRGEILYLYSGEQVRVLCTPDRGSVCVSLAGAEAPSLGPASRILFTLPLLELLKRRGFFGLHAAGLCAGGTALLFPGASGAGKSTLTLALLRAGYGFLSDDMLFLTADDSGVRVMAFPDEIDLTMETIAFFPELRSRKGWRPQFGRSKQGVRPEALYPVRLIRECRPGALVFPRIAGRERSSLRRMTPEEALLELAPNVLLTDPVSSQRHLDLLGELARTRPCWRLETGTDFEVIPYLLERLVAPVST